MIIQNIIGKNPGLKDDPNSLTNKFLDCVGKLLRSSKMLNIGDVRLLLEGKDPLKENNLEVSQKLLKKQAHGKKDVALDIDPDFPDIPEEAKPEEERPLPPGRFHYDECFERICIAEHENYAYEVRNTQTLRVMIKTLFIFNHLILVIYFFAAVLPYWRLNKDSDEDRQ